MKCSTCAAAFSDTHVCSADGCVHYRGSLDDAGAVGWTAREYMASPEMASRLHGRILDLEAERDRYLEALQLIASPNRLTYERPGDAVAIAQQALAYTQRGQTDE